MAPTAKYKYKSKELQKMLEWRGEDRLKEDIKRFGSGGLYGGKKARRGWNSRLIQLSPELDEAFKRKEFGQYFDYEGDEDTTARHPSIFSDKYLLREVKETVADHPALAVELGFSKRGGRRLPKTRKEGVKLLLDIRNIAKTPGSAEALGIDLDMGGMTPTFWDTVTSSDYPEGKGEMYSIYENDIKQYQDIERMESKIEPLKIRRTAEDKIMDGFIQQDNKYKMGK